MLKRLPLFIAILACVFFLAHHVTNHLIATSLIAYRTDAASRALAVSYAPSHPAIVAAHGRYLLYRADQPQLAEGLSALQGAAALTPNDYRYQLELGRAYASNGQPVEAERALQQAMQLAPRHFETHWAYANFALRNQQREAALAAFRRALELAGQDRAYRLDVAQASAHNAYSALVGAYGFDLGALEQVTPATPVSQTYLVSFLARPASLDLALAKWRNLPVANAALYRNLLFQLLVETQQAGRWIAAREIWLRLLTHEGESLDGNANLLTNGGFERMPLGERYPQLAQGFDWQLKGHAEVAADRTDTQAHTGANSLRLRLVARPTTIFQHVTQRVIVTPGAAYRLRFWIKSYELPNETPYFEIVDAAAPERFVVRLVLPKDALDWHEVSARLTVPMDTNLLMLRLCAPPVGMFDQSLSHTAWLDDVSLQRE